MGRPQIRKNDQVLVRVGKDRGKRGRVLFVLPEKNRLVVEGVNLIKRHTKPNPQKNIKGGIVEREASIHLEQRDADRSGEQRADAHRQQDARRWPPGAHWPQERRGGGQMSKAKKPAGGGGGRRRRQAPGADKAAAEKAAKSSGAKSRGGPARLVERYRAEVVPALSKEFGYPNVMAVPRVTKVVVNMGLGEATQNAKVVDIGADELAKITGQKAAVRRAKKSIAQFKVRQGMPIAAMVTLRGERMYEFLDRLMNIALPRVRDFRGVSPKGFDGRGNYTLGLRDQLIFVEIDYLKVDHARGMNVCVTTSAKTDEEARRLLQLLGMPFRQN